MFLAMKSKRDTHLISAIVKRRMSVQIIPRMSLMFPSMISEGRCIRVDKECRRSCKLTFRSDISELDAPRRDKF
jgi:hypothetical protein